MQANIAFGETVKHDLDESEIRRRVEWLSCEEAFPTMATVRRTRQISVESVDDEEENSWHVVSANDSETIPDSIPAPHDHSWECVDAGIKHLFVTVAERSAGLESSELLEKATKREKTPTRTQEKDAAPQEGEEEEDMGTLAVDMMEHRKSMGCPGAKGTRRRFRRNLDLLSITNPNDVFYLSAPNTTTTVDGQEMCLKHGNSACSPCKKKLASQWERRIRKRSWRNCRPNASKRHQKHSHSWLMAAVHDGED